MGCDAYAQNLIADPTFANSTTTTTTTSEVTDGKWQFEQASPAGTTITFPSTTQFSPGNKGVVYAIPLNTGGSQIVLTNGTVYSYSVKVYGNASDNVFMINGSANLTFAGGGASGATYMGNFTATGFTSVGLYFYFPSADPAMGLTNVSVQIATPELRSVIFCAFLAVGICGVERRRLRKIFKKACPRIENGKWKMEDGIRPEALN